MKLTPLGQKIIKRVLQFAALALISGFILLVVTDYIVLRKRVDSIDKREAPVVVVKVTPVPTATPSAAPKQIKKVVPVTVTPSK